MAYKGTAEYPAIVARAVRDSFRFTGRSTRTDLVVYYLATVLIGQVIGWIAILALEFEQTAIALQVLSFAFLIPLPALLVRRCHDQDRTGRWVWIPAMVFMLSAARTFVGISQGIEARINLDKTIWPLDWLATLASILTIILVMLPGTVGPNRFGLDPRGRE